MKSVEPKITVQGRYKERKSKPNNFKSLHGTGLVQLEVDGVLREMKQYTSKKQRAEWLSIYSRQIKKNYVIIIKPNWDLWNGHY